MPNHDIDQLRNTVSTLERERRQSTDEQNALEQQQRDIRDAMRRIDNELMHLNPFARSDLRSRRHSLEADIRAVGERINRLVASNSGQSEGLMHARNRLARAEYDSVSAGELESAGNAIARKIANAEKRLADIAIERETLSGKREEAEQAGEVVSNARSELQAAREALESAQGESFIAGTKTDFSHLQARIGKAEKRLEEATKASAAAKAALPRIAARMSTLDDETAELQADRADLVAQWHVNRTRRVDLAYTATAIDLVALMMERIALDRLTGSRVGESLRQELYSGLRVPLMGAHTEPLLPSRWFAEDVPQADTIGERIASELQAAIGANRLKG